MDDFVESDMNPHAEGGKKDKDEDYEDEENNRER